MSERSKGDVSSSSSSSASSRVNNITANRVVKNPLLSASVTGLSYDDFPNKPLLLPAAPPVVHAPPPQPTTALIAGILNREPKSLVTVGQASSIDDSETLDEINLNASGSDDSVAAQPSTFGSNPYQSAADANANPLLEPPPSSDSLLSQAASSFGALPSVASNVFSTFSKRIYGEASEEQHQQQQQPQLEIQPNYIQQAGQVLQAAAPAPFYAAPPPAVGESAPEPPKFYAPTELPTLGANPGSLPPPASAAQNTYRISAKKKLYAPIPGLSEQQQAPQIQQPALPPTLPFQTPPYPAQPAPIAVPAAAPAPAPAPEERKGGGLFSLTSFVPQGVLQNISGLVNSAIGNEPVQQAPVSYGATNPSYFDITTGGAASSATNYFAPGPAQAPAPAPAPSAGYFVPTEAPPTVGGFFNPVSVAAPPATVGGFFTPQPAAAPVAASQPSAVAAPPPTAFAASAAVAQPPAAATPPAVVPPLQAVAPPAVAAPVDSSAAFGAPPAAAAVPPPPAGQTSYRLQKGTRLYKSPLTAQETAGVAATPFATLPAVAPAAIFNPFGGAAATSQATLAPASHQAPPTAPNQLPPVAATALPGQLPPAASTALPGQEVPPNSASLFAPVPSSTAEATIANQFAAPQQGASQEVPLLSGAPEVGLIPAQIEATQLFAPAQTQLDTFKSETTAIQEVPLFAVAPTVPGVPVFPAQTQDLSAPATQLFAPAQTQPFASKEESVPTQQAVELFAVPTSVPEVPLFAAPSAAPEVPLFPPTEQTQDLPGQQSSASLFATEQVEAKGFGGVAVAGGVADSVDQKVSLLPSAAPETTQDIKFYPSEAATSLFPPATEQGKSEPAQEVPLYPPIVSTPVETQQEVPLFVPVPSAEAAQGVALYPPTSASATEASTACSLFAATQAVSTPLPATGLPAELTQPASAALTTQTTTTFYNPFAQTITTPLPQDLIAPPIGFVAPAITQAAATEALFAAQTIEPVLPEEEKKPAAALATLPPPPSKPKESTSQANPFRRSSETVAVAVTSSTEAASPLLSFFTPAASSNNDFNFFAEQSQQTAEAQFPPLPEQVNPASPSALQEAPITSGVLGFEQLISECQQTTRQNVISNQIPTDYQNSSVNSFSGFFNGSEEATTAQLPQQLPQSQAQPQSQNCNSLNFFDNFSAGAQGQQEDQLIQNFFNNPPLLDQPAAPGELKYDIVHSGLPSKQFEERSQTSVSNLVEPPSSACSEFSTITTAAGGTSVTLSAPTEANSGSVAAAAAVASTEASQREQLLQQYQGELPEELLQQLRMANEKGQAIAPPAEAVVYTPALVHWFYKRNVDGKFLWLPFSHYDSALLETSLTNDEIDATSNVPVEGGRYDVNIKERTKSPVYWEGKATEVRRCSWFYKGIDSKLVPYSEATAEALEAEYKRATETGEWQKKIPLGNGEQVTMHGPNVIVHFMPPSNADTWGGSVQTSSRPLVVRRDLNDFKIQQGESQRVDHLLFMVHGIGSACDLKMRNVEEVVDDFRNIAQQLVQSHYKNSTDMGLVGRVEVLPIEWHGHLHSEELGIDEKLKSITLESIPRLRNFTNDTLLDVLFYTSPKYCQKIMNTVADALNEVYLKYRMRHPEFNGGVSLAGHSLGSLILFDLLCHQEPLKECEEENKENPDQLPQKPDSATKLVPLPNNDQMLPKQVSYAMGLGPAGTGQPVINYTQLIFHPKKFFALGSPIGMFVTIRGIDKLGLDFRLPTCPGFYNIFHPFDPVAYRIEALVNPDMKGIRPVLIPHHKGRKRMHLELKETMTRVGADIKQRFMDTFKNTLDSVSFLSTVTKVKREAEESVEKEVFRKQSEEQDEHSIATTSTQARNRSDSESTTASDPEFIELDFPLGKLNDSKRVDYVLQEAPLEFINEYIFALSSHVCYWGSEDTILFVMKEIYSGLGISTDSQVPQQSMTIERPSSRTNSIGQSLLPM